MTNHYGPKNTELREGSQKGCLVELDRHLPKTSLRHYLTGIAALNIPSGTSTGDWHFIETFEGAFGRPPGPFFLAGINYSETYGVFGSEGIEDRSASIREGGISVTGSVYAADHYRAMGDLIYHRLSKELDLNSCVADDWFPSIDDKETLRERLIILSLSLKPKQRDTLDKWLYENDLYNT